MWHIVSLPKVLLPVVFLLSAIAAETQAEPAAVRIQTIDGEEVTVYARSIIDALPEAAQANSGLIFDEVFTNPGGSATFTSILYPYRGYNAGISIVSRDGVCRLLGFSRAGAYSRLVTRGPYFGYVSLNDSGHLIEYHRSGYDSPLKDITCISA